MKIRKCKQNYCKKSKKYILRHLNVSCLLIYNGGLHKLRRIEWGRLSLFTCLMVFDISAHNNQEARAQESHGSQESQTTDPRQGTEKEEGFF